MDRLEMIEKIRKCADVSYEEARQALDQADGDLLEAIVILEKQGKVRKGEAQTEGSVNSSGEKTRGARSAIGNAIRSAWRFLRNTRFHVTRNGKEIFVMPSLVLGFLLICFFYTILPVMLIAMLFDVRYSFTGNEAADKANNVLSKAGSVADGVRSAAEKAAENAID